jgi:alkylated DNA nucleotide flippase Atl1
MHVQEIRLQQVLEGAKQYRVPLYQRTYSWSPKQLTRLWSDVVDLADARLADPRASHFTGSLVLSTGGVGPGGTEFLVVDGQQRLTTLSVLIAAIRDHISKTDPDTPEKVARLHETYLSDRFKHGDDRLKLLPTQADRVAFRAIVDNATLDGMHSGVIDAYRFFRTRLVEADDPDDPHDIDRIASAVLDGLVFVAITAGHEDNVYRIFESLNNTGMKLTQGDLLRNYIFMRLGSRGEDVYTAVWLPMQTLLSSADLEALFWMDITWSTPEAKQGDIYALQEARLSRLTDNDVEFEVRRYARLADLLSHIRDPERCPHSSLRERLKRLNEWGSNAADPLILYILSLQDAEMTDVGEAAKSLDVLESYFVRRLLINAPTSALSRILLRAAGDIDSSDVPGSLHRYLSTGRKFFATDRQVAEAVIAKPFYYSGRPTQRKTLLAWLERTQAGKEPASLASATIEHVMPQTLTTEWRDSLSLDLGEFATVDELHEAYLHTLANLTLTGYNSELSNAPFSTKRALLAESNIALNKPIAAAETWGRQQILGRGASLAEAVRATWVAPLAETDVVESGVAWKLAAEVVESIPRGRWTTYGNVATIAGTHPVPLGGFLGKNFVANAWRVLQAGGTISPGFRWPSDSPYEGLDPREVLIEEGVEFDLDGRADPDSKLEVSELAELLGVQVDSPPLESESDDSDERESQYLAQMATRFTPATIHGVIEVIQAWRGLGGYVTFGNSNDIGAFLHVREPGSASHIWPLVIYSYGSVEVVFQWLAGRPPFDDVRLRSEFRIRLNRARGVAIEDSKLKVRPSFSVDVLADVNDRRSIIDALEWFIEIVSEHDRLIQTDPAGEHGTIKFTLDGEQRELSREIVTARLTGHAPGNILTYWVDVEGVRWPVKQVLAIALGLDTKRFQSWDARRHLEALGFEVGRS